MVFRSCASNIAQQNTHPNWAEAGAARSKKAALWIALNAMLSRVIVVLVLLVPAYCQQEIDPAWYDPWAAPNKTVVTTHRRDRLIAKNGGKSGQPSVGHKGKRRQLQKQLAIASAPRKWRQVR
jgi:hypothetical protein